MGAIHSGKCGERFPQLSPTQKAGFGGIWGVGRLAATTCCCFGRGGARERKGGWGRRGRHGPGYWSCRASPHSLSRQCMWRDSEGHVIAVVVQHWLEPPAWPHCRAARASVAPVVLARQAYSVVPLCVPAQ